MVREPDPSAIDPESLLRNVRFVRRLALRILRDEHAADDAAQDALLKALQVRPRAARSIKTWLGVVVRNLAQRMRKRAEWRRAWERQAARQEAVPGGDVLAERGELLRAVVAAVLALAEPARSIVLMHYLDEVPVAEIARRANLPVETVRSRLKRALTELRTVLVNEHGGSGRSWFLLAPRAHRLTRASHAQLGTVLSGAAIVSVNLKTVAVVCLGTASLLVWFCDDRHQRPNDQPSSPAIILGEADAPAPERLRRIGLDAGAAQTAVADPRMVPHVLHGGVFDADGSGVAGAIVRVKAHELVSGLVLRSTPSDADLAVTTTDAAGGFTVSLGDASPVDLVAQAAGYSPASSVDQCVDRTVVMHLERGATIEGRVFRAEDEKAVAGARVSVRQYPAFGPSDLVETTTDVLGAFRLEHVPSGDVTVWAIPVLEAVTSVQLTVLDGATVHRDIGVRTGATVSGVVRSALTAAPIANASVQVGTVCSKATRTNELGEYALAGVLIPTSHVEGIWVRAEGFGVQERFFFDELTAGIKRVDWDLLPGRVAHGRVVDDSGEPIVSAKIVAFASDLTHGMQRTDRVAATSDADGTFTLANLRVDAGHALLVRCERYGTVVYDFPPADAQQPEIDLGDVVLPGALHIEGCVRDRWRHPLAGAKVKARGLNGDRFRWSGKEVAAVGSYAGDYLLRTGQDGCFRLDDLAPGEYQLWVQIDDLPPHRQSVRLEASAAVPFVELVVDRDLCIDGMILDEQGRPVLGVDVELVPVSRDNEVRWYESTNGFFVFEHVPWGMYSVEARTTSAGGLRRGVQSGDRLIKIALTK